MAWGFFGGEISLGDKPARQKMRIEDNFGMKIVLENQLTPAGAALNFLP